MGQAVAPYKQGAWFFKYSSRQWEMSGWISPGPHIPFQQLEQNPKLLVGLTRLSRALIWRSSQRWCCSGWIQSGQSHLCSSDNLSVSSSWAHTAPCRVHWLLCIYSWASSSPHKCFPHRVTGSKPVTKWVKAQCLLVRCPNPLLDLAQDLCEHRVCFSALSAKLCENHFQEKIGSSVRSTGIMVKVSFHFSH